MVFDSEVEIYFGSTTRRICLPGINLYLTWFAGVKYLILVKYAVAFILSYFSERKCLFYSGHCYVTGKYLIT
jgi:hypothetical protein